LIELAEEHHVTLFVGHVFLYSAAVAKLKKLVKDGDLGDICYIASSRLNLGPVRQDVNALWDLAPHDVSIMLELIEELPTEVSCSGLAYLNGEVHDVCSLTLHFDNSQLGIVHVSWLDPRKKREMTVVGSRKMVVYDDLEPLEKVKVYDIGVDVPQDADSFGEYQFTFRYGDTYSPRLIQFEPLKAECSNFIQSVIDGSAPRTDGYNGLHVVSVIEAAERSLNNAGGRVKVARVSLPAVTHLPPQPESAVIVRSAT
jgi:predicted dehydrogenase